MYACTNSNSVVFKLAIASVKTTDYIHTTYLEKYYIPVW